MPPAAEMLGIADIVQLGIGGTALILLIFAFARGWISTARDVRKIEAAWTKLVEQERRRGDEWKETAAAEGRRADRAEEREQTATRELSRAALAWEGVQRAAIEQTGHQSVSLPREGGSHAATQH